MFVSMNKSIQIILQTLLIVSASLMLVNCGGGSGTTTTPTTATLNGTAATGIPIDGVINVTDSLGATANASIDASGNYTVDVTGMTPPFIIAAVPNDNTLDTQYSFAAQANITVNVTPLTTLTLFNASGEQDPADLVSNWTTQFNSITQQAINDAMDIINANLSTQLTNAGLDPAAFDLFSSAFNADSTGFDGILDLLDISFNPGSGFTINFDGSTISFDPNIVIGGGVISGNLGSTTMSGDDTSVIGESFTPNLAVPIIGPTAGSVGWSAGVGVGMTIGFFADGTVTTVFFSTPSGTDLYTYFVGCQVPGADCSGIVLDLVGQSVTFTNAVLPIGASLEGSNLATASLTVSGTLNWE